MNSKNDCPILLYLWKQRTLYIGELPHIPNLTPGASTLLLGMEKPFSIRNHKTGEERIVRSALIPAGTHFGADPQGQYMVNCYLDPLGHDTRRLSTLMQHQLGAIWTDSITEHHQLNVFNHILKRRMPPSEAYTALTEHVFPTETQGEGPLSNDARVTTVINLIQNDPLSNVSTDRLAEQAGLTPSQLNRWFKKITGVPVRRYRLWHRLFITATLMGQGKNLTEAAHEAGFSDSSHLNHTFRSMLGLTPSFVFQRSDRLHIFAHQGQ